MGAEGREPFSQLPRTLASTQRMNGGGLSAELLGDLEPLSGTFISE